MVLTQEEADSIIDTINERALEVRQLIITVGSILALLMPGVEMLGIIDLTPYGEGDDEWIGDSDWEWGDDFECGDGSRIEAALVDDGYKNCRDGSDEPDESDECELDDSCEEPEVQYGCTDQDALNYDPEAWEDDGSCEYEEEQEETWGCTNDTATNYDPYADHDDGSCEYPPEEAQSCDPKMYDAWWYYSNESEIIYIEWDADLACDDEPQNLTVIWTIYENETGNWTGLQEQLTYETYYQDWDYVNLTLDGLRSGKYDIFATFEIHGDYTRGVDWYAVEVE